MTEETITFELIRKIQREEQRLPKLTKLPEDIFPKIASYLQQKRRISEGKEDRKVSIEIKSIERLIEDIFNRRERKIINQALIAARTGIPPENLTDEEKDFFEVLVISIKQRRGAILDNIFTGLKEEDVGLIVFKEDVPEFVAVDQNTYGPFKKGDIAKLPEDNVKVLLERGIVEQFKVSK